MPGLGGTSPEIDLISEDRRWCTLENCLLLERTYPGSLLSL